MGDGERGYCRLRTARRGRIVHLAGTPRRGLVEWYRDPLPTNCVADWVCAGRRRPGDHNLAVFYASCSSDCLFCQNWHFRAASPGEGGLSTAELAAAANPRTFCVCFFGGDPASQMPHALAAGAALAKKGVVVCWETAGPSRPRLLDRAVDLSLASGGCVKFDLKAWDDSLHRALTGVSNGPTLENFARSARRARERPDPPLVVASTLLVPGYVDAEEVARLAAFIAAIDADIPYALLAFAPHFAMGDLPRTSRRHAEEALSAARAAGLRNVRLGNAHLLSTDY
jgi:pyruvate formate lyase activating enzyme